MQEVTPTIPEFTKQEGLNEELAIKGIYLRSKVIKKEITADGVYSIICGFPPRVVFASCQESSQASDGSTDFSFTFSIRKYNNLGVFATSETTNLVTLSTMVAVPTKRLSNGFTITVSSFSGGNKNIYFTCLS